MHMFMCSDAKTRASKEGSGSNSNSSGGGKYHTLNRRTHKKPEQDPYSSLRYNVDSDSRLRGHTLDSSEIKRPSKDDVRHSISLDMRAQGAKTLPPLQGSEVLHHSSIDIRSSPSKPNGTTSSHSPDKPMVREAGQHVGEKRLSNGVIPHHAPISTKGEVTNDASTSASSVEKRQNASTPSSTNQTPASFHKAGSAPPTLPGAEGEEEGGSGYVSKGQWGKGAGGNLGVPSNRTGKNTHSPLEQSSRSNPAHSSQVYDHLDDLPMQPKGKTTPTFDQATSSYEESLFYLDKRRSGSLSRSSNSSGGSGVYDHLPTVDSPDPPLESPVGGPRDISKVTDLSMLNALGDFSGVPRRNFSHPALSTPNSARESPCDQFGRFKSIDEESSDEDESQRSVTPTNEETVPEIPVTINSKHPGVMLRDKKKESLISDPFADIMSPKSASRLRWSQELNPLYDYIKGFKVSEGVKLYDSTPSKLVKSAKAASSGEGVIGNGDSEEKEAGGGGANSNGKPPSMIMEEEGDDEEISSIWDAEILSNFSQDTMSMVSQDTEQSPTSPTSSLGGECFGGDTLSLTNRVNGSKPGGGAEKEKWI